MYFVKLGKWRNSMAMMINVAAPWIYQVSGDYR